MQRHIQHIILKGRKLFEEKILWVSTMDNMLHQTITSLPCYQVKIEPASDNQQDSDQQVTTDSAVIQEVTEDDYLIKEEGNQMQTSDNNEDMSGADTHCHKSTIFIKKEGSSSIQGKDTFLAPVSTTDNVLHHIITSLSCQIKTEPASDNEQDYDQKCIVDNAFNSAIKQEVTEVDKIDACLIKQEEVNQMHTSDCDENSGDKTNGHKSTLSPHPHVKSENDSTLPIEVEREQEIMSNIMSEEMDELQYCADHVTDEKQIFQVHQTNRLTNVTSHSCSVCGQVFEKSQAYLRHMWHMHTGGKPYTCNVCGKTFKHLSSFKRHQECHSNERLYSCDLCEKTFKQKCGLLQHQVCHSNEMPYSCDVCEKTFKHKSNLQQHKESIHSNERCYSCDVCEKTFTRKSNLQRHKTTCHSSERPHACDLCEKSFKLNSDLQKHKEAYHSSERPYSCDMCGQAFKLKDILQKHKVSHSDERPFSCDICEMAFKRKSDLQKHKTVSHTDERPHICDVCGKSFKVQSYLVKHKTIHTGDKPHECGICGRAFLQKHHVHLHIQKVHEKQSF